LVQKTDVLLEVLSIEQTVQALLGQVVAEASVIVDFDGLLRFSETLRLRTFGLLVADARVSHLKVFFNQVFHLALDWLTLFVGLARNQMLLQVTAEAVESSFLFHLYRNK
jgi:hypothetical protein